MTATQEQLSAEALLTSQRKMDDFIHTLAHLKLDNATGGAYRSVCLAAFREGVLLQSDHHTNCYCSIKITSKPGLKIKLGAQDSRFNGNPHPSVIDGEWVTVWSDGKWVKEGPWVPHVISVVEYYINRVNEKRQEQKEQAEIDRQQRIDLQKAKDQETLNAWSNA